MCRFLLIGCAWLLVTLLQFPALGATERTDRFCGLQSLRHATCDHTRYDSQYGGVRLADRPEGGFSTTGTIIYDQLRYGGGFTEVIPSWNAVTPPGTGLTLEVAASFDDGALWSQWLPVAQWGQVPPLVHPVTGAVEPKDAWARVDADTLLLKSPGDRLKVRITLFTADPDRTPILRQLCLAVRDTPSALRMVDRQPSSAWGKALNVPHRAQADAPPDQSWRVCGPTSLGMALAACGLYVPPATVINRCWDEKNKIYGNWAFLAAAGSSLLSEHWQRLAGKLPPQPGSHAARVDWAPDWQSIEQEISLGHPCLLSIYYNAGELTGAPVTASDGHIVMVSGFTRTGQVIVHDPAGRTAKTGRVIYDRTQLHQARHGGPAIILCPTPHAKP